MTELNYKAANIAKAERLHSANFFKTIEGFGDESPSLSDILFVLEAGGLTEDEAGEMVDSKGLVESIELAVKSLTESGFLAKALDVDMAKIQEANQKVTSRTTGEATKQ